MTSLCVVIGQFILGGMANPTHMDEAMGTSQSLISLLVTG
jgi:hypothetical protein